MSEQAAEQSFRESFREQIGHTDDSAADETPPEAKEPVQPEGQARDEAGRFAAQEQTVEPEAVAEDVQRFIEHHGGGDPNKALAAAAKMQRQSGNLQELQRLQGIEQQLHDLQQRFEPEPGYVDETSQSWFDQAIVEQPYAAAEWARENAPHLLPQAMQEWYQQNPAEATEYRIALNNQQLLHYWQTQNAPAQQLVQEEQLGQALANAAQRHEEFRDDATVQRMLEQPQIQYLINGPLKNAITAGSQQERLQALDTVLYTYRGINGQQPAVPQQETGSHAPTGAPAPQANPAQLARVVSSNISPPRGAPSQDDKARALFRDMIGGPEALGLE